MASTLNIVGFEAIPAPASLSGRIRGTVDEARNTYAESVEHRNKSESLLIDACEFIAPLADIIELAKSSKMMTQEVAVRTYFGSEQEEDGRTVIVPADMSKSDCTAWANACFAVRDMHPPKAVQEKGREALSEFARHYRDLEKVTQAVQADMGNGTGAIAKENAEEVLSDLHAMIDDGLSSIEGNARMAVSDVITQIGREYVDSQVDYCEQACEAAQKLIKKNGMLRKRVNSNKETGKASKTNNTGAETDPEGFWIEAETAMTSENPEDLAKFIKAGERRIGRNGMAKFASTIDRMMTA